MDEPKVKRAISFIDGQNLYRSAKHAFGYTYPNYDPLKLSQAICSIKGWELQQARFYTGVPDSTDNDFWHHFWSGKLLVMKRAGVIVYKRSLRYRNKTVSLPDGTEYTFLSGDEKGIDIRIALDIISLAHNRSYDVAIVFSQDQDYSEAADEVRVISQEQNRWIKIASAFPASPTYKNGRGINNTDWIRFKRDTYDKCLDTNDYRPKTR